MITKLSPITLNQHHLAQRLLKMFCYQQMLIGQKMPMMLTGELHFFQYCMAIF